MKKLAALCVISLMNCFAQNPSRAFLDRLRGSWYMVGSVMSKPVGYAAEGAWVLQGQFFSLHMKDTANPPAYEATLFIGIDSARQEYVAHWLDSFGGAGARVVGFGPLSGEKIEIIFPYPEGKFRNLFKFDSVSDRWSLLIESEGNGGRWSVFAQYTITRNR